MGGEGRGCSMTPIPFYYGTAAGGIGGDSGPLCPWEEARRTACEELLHGHMA